MTGPLWTWDELVRAASATADGAPADGISGFSIDTRTLEAGDVFVALKDVRDGHDFVPNAFERGAAAALVEKGYVRSEKDGALLRVDQTIQGLEGIARAARARSNAKIVAVTGSVGKTGTKEMLSACLSNCGPVHASQMSYNNHWGVPLTLARMPAAKHFGVFEIGMNHAGEITPLTKQVRPHVAVITTVEPVHLAHFASVEEIAEAKAEIFSGLVPGGTAILNRDNPYFDLLARRVREHGAAITTFGYHESADVRPMTCALTENGSDVVVRLDERTIAYRLGAPGAHVVQNSLAVVAVLAALGVDVEKAVGALSAIKPPKGRGTRSEVKVGGGSILLIDESYNANPASMRSALVAMAMVPRERYARRIAVLGDMLELGEKADELHERLKEAVDVAEADLVFACGPHMRKLYEALPEARRGEWAETSEGIEAGLADTVKPGDVVMIKGSLGSRMAPLVEALMRRDAKS